MNDRHYRFWKPLSLPFSPLFYSLHVTRILHSLFIFDYFFLLFLTSRFFHLIHAPGKSARGLAKRPTSIPFSCTAPQPAVRYEGAVCFFMHFSGTLKSCCTFFPQSCFSPFDLFTDVCVFFLSHSLPFLELNACICQAPESPVTSLSAQTKSGSHVSTRCESKLDLSP
jgi:hypothetical protein